MNEPDLTSCDDAKDNQINLTEKTRFTKSAREIFIIEEQNEPKPKVIIIGKHNVNLYNDKHIVYPKKSAATVESDKTSTNLGSNEMKQREIYIVREQDEPSPIITRVTRDEIDRYKNKHIVYPDKDIQEPYYSLFILGFATAYGAILYLINQIILEYMEEKGKLSPSLNLNMIFPYFHLIINLIYGIAPLVLWVFVIVGVWMVIRLIMMHKLVRMELTKQFRYILRRVLGKSEKSKSQ